MIDVPESLTAFIEEHSADNVATLRLKMSGKKESAATFPLEYALTQIEARQKCRRKLPTFIANPKFIFPSLVASEQATNEAVARFHASLMPQGTTLLDMTGGLGIDSMTFAKSGINVTTCEIDADKCNVLKHNSQVMGCADNLEVVCTDSISYIETIDKEYDIIFVDPARRRTTGKRVHALSDCEPNITECMPLILKHSRRVIVKCSPLLDLSFIKRTVEHLKHIFVVCFKGECKEVLIEISEGSRYDGTSVFDLDMDHIISEFTSKADKESKHNVNETAGTPAGNFGYLYEPNSGLMKTGDWSGLTERYPDLKKADVNTHLFLSDTFYPDFPGRTMKTDRPLDKKSIKEMKGKKANVSVRNYPLSAEQLSSKYGISPGGDIFIYAFRCAGKPVMLLTRTVTKDQQL